MKLLKQARIFTKLLKLHIGEGLISVVLFGSVGRGEERADSDIDLILVMKNLPTGRLKRICLLEPVLDAVNKRGLTSLFNCHIKTPEEAEKIVVMYYDLPDDAIILHDTNDFFKKVICGVKKRIKETGAVRKRIGRFHYWDLKPGAHADDIFEVL